MPQASPTLNPVPMRASGTSGRLAVRREDTNIFAGHPKRLQQKLLTDHSNIDIQRLMARTKEFDSEKALDAAIAVFREHGFEGTSAAMLTKAMKIGRQSLYDTFGDKWQLYCTSLQRYSCGEIQAHVARLRGPDRAIDGLSAMLGRVVAEARKPCLGISSVCEFGATQAELSAIRAAPARKLEAAIVRSVREAQAQGDVDTTLDAKEVASFLVSSIAGIRIAARGGASDDGLHALGKLVLRALR